ncbi:MAG: hypothetical protein OEW64_10710 [Gammaproteobacteria bacterium]|nr:hypothetical protein [Gammaproteobacteria bacterium]MDH5304554.1 hypothetical protein [Gammaproteobacteria bacterium]MDH5322642.1 hypothetical protein [Gammaproteobacteria bacterium]
MLTIYHNPACSKYHQALEILTKNGETPVVIRYLDQPPENVLQLIETRHE